jgi:hypothetical protein
MVLPLHIPTMRACHLVTPVFLHERVLATVALPDQSCRHGFFDNVSQSYLAIFIRLLAGKRYVCLLLAKSTAGLAALLVLATKLLVNFHRRTFHLEVAKGTFRQKVKASSG